MPPTGEANIYGFLQNCSSVQARRSGQLPVSRLSGAIYPNDEVYFEKGVFLRHLQYASRIMDTQTQTSSASLNGVTQKSSGVKRWLRSSFFTALIGACGFGMLLQRTTENYRDRGFLNIALGLIFLAMAVVHPARVLPFIPKGGKSPQR
jgi:hypothetical protein